MTENKMALVLGFVGFMAALALIWQRDANRCEVIARDPLGILTERR